MRLASRLVAFVLLACIALASCKQSPRPNIVLILVDTLRADRLGAWGNQRGLTPFMDELASQGTVFQNAYSTTAYTTPAVASLFTSRYPSQHRVLNADSVLGDAEITLAEQLASLGYATAAFTANILIDGQWGFGQGFDHFFSMRLRKMRAYTIRQRVRQWLDTPRSGNAPLFLYLHYFDPHGPYEPPAPFRTQLHIGTDTAAETAAKQKSDLMNWKGLLPEEVALLASLYDAEVAAFDAQLRIQLDELRERGVLDNAIVAITADHGEEFYEHNQMGHGRSLYNELIHIPLLFIVPDTSAATVREPVSLVDVAPTILALVDQPVPPTFEGRSLVGLLGRSPMVERLRSMGIPVGGRLAPPCLFELERNSAQFDLRQHTAGIIKGSTKLLQKQTGEELYELASNPSEVAVLARADGDRAATLRAQLEDIRARLQQRAARAPESKELDDATKEKIRALGYHAN